MLGALLQWLVWLTNCSIHDEVLDLPNTKRLISIYIYIGVIESYINGKQFQVSITPPPDDTSGSVGAVGASGSGETNNCRGSGSSPPSPVRMCFGSGVTFSEAVVLAVGAGVIGVFVAANIRLEPLRQSPGVATT